jgi:hypothetical protein
MDQVQKPSDSELIKMFVTSDKPKNKECYLWWTQLPHSYPTVIVLTSAASQETATVGFLGLSPNNLNV